MPDPLVVLCPGQGAQTVGMGRAWAEHSDGAKRIFERADEVLGDRLGAPLSTLCSEGPADVLNRTDVAQPALYVAGVACFNALFGSAGHAPLAATAGLSLGEYTALHLAGAIDFESGLELVVLRGRAMQDAAEATPSSMVALTGADESQGDEICVRAAEGDVLVCANLNAPGQVVLSGHKRACSRALEVASKLGVRATPLSVAGAFHSPIMASAAQRLAQAIDEVTIRPPTCPVMSNVTGEPHEADSGAIGARLVDQLTKPVRWGESCAWLAVNVRGVYHEIAPGRVLSGLMRRIDRSIKVISHDQPEA